MIRCTFLGLLGLGMALVPAMSQTTLLSVANPSFESPVWTGPLPVDIRMDGWTKTPAPSWFVPQGPLQSWEQVSGIFPNPPEGQPGRIPNGDGSQAAYLLTLPLAGFSQVLGATFEAGVAYELAVGVRGGGNIVEGSPLTVSLFYLDATFQPVTLGSTTVSYNAGMGAAWPSLTEVTAGTGTVEAGSLAEGRHVGVSIMSVGGMGEGYWDLDNVRVRASVVPEPGMVAMVVAGGAMVGLMGRRRG